MRTEEQCVGERGATGIMRNSAGRRKLGEWRESKWTKTASERSKECRKRGSENGSREHDRPRKEQ